LGICIDIYLHDINYKDDTAYMTKGILEIVINYK
jgi:hypothetical protein